MNGPAAEAAHICECKHYACQPCAIMGFDACGLCNTTVQNHGTIIQTYSRAALQNPEENTLNRHVLLNSLQHSCKTKAVFDKLKEIAGLKEKAIVFSQWISAVDILEKLCRKGKMQCVRADGSMVQNVRQKNVNRFRQDPEVFHFRLCAFQCRYSA